MAAPESPSGGSAIRRVLDRVAAIPAAIVLIDGFSGAGKSTFADRLVTAWGERRGIRPQLLRLELVYPGWEGLRAASEALLRDVLQPVAAGRGGSWQRWDWTADAPAERHPVSPSAPLVVEGVGALSRTNRAIANLGVWVELDAAERMRRALERDGDTYRPHWERWARQEREFADRERPRELADLEVDGRSITTMDR